MNFCEGFESFIWAAGWWFLCQTYQLISGNHQIPFKVDDYLKKCSSTGPEIFMVVSSHEKEEESVKNNLVIVEKMSRFIRGLTAEKTNSQISQNRARLCTFKMALNPSESLPKQCIKPYHHRPFFGILSKKLQNFPQNGITFSTIHRPLVAIIRETVFCLWFIIAQLFGQQYLSGVSSFQIGN